MNKLILILSLLFCSQTYGQSVSRYKVNTYDGSIVELQTDLVQGLIKEKIAEEFIGGLNELNLEDLANKLKSSDERLIKNAALKIDGVDTKITPKSILFVFLRTGKYIHDLKKDGSIEYSYDFNYKNWLVHRYMKIENDKVSTNISVYGHIYTQVDWPKVVTTINYANLSAEFFEKDTTNIQTTITLGYNQSYGARCRLIRRISSNVAPSETKTAISSEVDHQLYNITNTVGNVVESGQNYETLVDKWFSLLNNINRSLR